MNTRPIRKIIYSKAHIIKRRIRYNYYFRNRLERERNRKLLEKARKSQKNNLKNTTPFISVVIATYNRGKILTERTIPSVLRQTYQNFEVIIVGDRCTDDTEELVAGFKNKRIKFYNLPERSEYPDNPYDRWLVIGTVPQNKTIELSSGEWIAPLDDDDEFSDDHLEVLLNHASREHDFEMVYGKVQWEARPNEWRDLGSYPLRFRKISQMSVLYHAKLKFFKYDINAWKYGEPNDWNMWRRMKEAGVRIGFLDKVVGKHYLEMTQKGRG